ncbi:46 kDa FK506-binding nuclear protein-like isoform X4 [Palaemon carinicauda]|uniref:46 kDa FK506-binding nuclear protein-like isoform X4 n=1 Tax=Palaemon carinicauda TaxID=392227 RepID=UPI0035B658AB
MSGSSLDTTFCTYEYLDALMNPNGLILEPGKRYSRLVDVPFHITAAVLDTITGGGGKDEIVSVMLEVDGMEVIICNLSLNRGIIQVPLNLKFDVGCKIAFFATGTSSNVHLSGNVIGCKENNTNQAMKNAGKFTEKKRKLDTESAGAPKKAKVAASTMLNPFEAEEDEESFSEGEMDEDSDDEDDDEEEDDDEDEDDDEEEDDDDEDDSEEDTDSEEQIESKALNQTPKGKQTNNLSVNASESPKSIKGKINKSPNTAAATPKKEMGVKVQTLNGASQKQKGAENKNIGSPQTNTPKVMKMGGLSYTDLVVGTGVEAKQGKNVGVYYEGRLASNKKMFDKCYSGKPFKFRLGSNGIIKGWNVAVNGMKVGGKRKFVCPPHLGYGKRGAPPEIPPNAALEFVVELKTVG